MGQMMDMETRRILRLLSKCRKIWMIEFRASGVVGNLQRRPVKDICLIANRSTRPISSNKEAVNHRFQPREAHKLDL